VFKAIYRLLEIPFVYRLSQVILAPGRWRLITPVFSRIFDPKTQRVLEIGCGPTPITPEPEKLLVGVDINSSYIKEYTLGFLDVDPNLIFNPPAARRRLGYLAKADKLPFQEPNFDEARSISFFHHLTDEEVILSVREMYRCILPGGRIIIFEDVWPKSGLKRPAAWLIRRFDRGGHMRHEEHLIGLFQKALPGALTWERLTYTYTGLEYVCVQFVKA